MELDKLEQKFYLFSQSSLMLNDRANHYLPRFNYSACELWLCAEICHLVNYDGGNIQSISDGDIFLYNEDFKRDLTLYSGGITNKPTILHHIEVKLIYPTAVSKFTESVNSLYDKIYNSGHSDYNQEGWVYLVWTQHYDISPDVFFESRVEWLKSLLDSKECYDKENKKLITLYSHLHDIAEGSIKWRGENKKIIVKAISFTLKNFREITKDVKKEWSETFKIPADR